MATRMRIAITGATGLLGRNLLFEILKQNQSDLERLEIFVLGRGSAARPLDARIDEMLRDDGAFYVGAGLHGAEAFCAEARTSIRAIPFDLERDDLGLSDEDHRELRREPIDLFFHVAALTDLRDSPIIRENLEETNVRGTRRILHLLAGLDVGLAVYVGSAFSCGSISGVAEPDDVDLDRVFRTPYERTKVRCEFAFRSFAERRGLRYKVFRPAILGGRLIEEPIGAMCKFDVFYGWAAFFIRQKLVVLGDRDRDGPAITVRGVVGLLGPRCLFLRGLLGPLGVVGVLAGRVLLALAARSEGEDQHGQCGQHLNLAGGSQGSLRGTEVGCHRIQPG